MFLRSVVRASVLWLEKPPWCQLLCCSSEAGFLVWAQITAVIFISDFFYHCRSTRVAIKYLCFWLWLGHHAWSSLSRKIISQLIVKLCMGLLIEVKRTEAQLIICLLLKTLTYSMFWEFFLPPPCPFLFSPPNYANLALLSPTKRGTCLTVESRLRGDSLHWENLKIHQMRLYNF